MTEERRQRLQKIAEEIDVLIREIGPKMIRVAHLRKEAEEIIKDHG